MRHFIAAIAVGMALMGAHTKDLAELETGRAICKGLISVAEDQHLFATDWAVAYCRCCSQPFPEYVASNQ